MEKEEYNLSLIKIKGESYNKNLHIAISEFPNETACGIEYTEEESLQSFDNEKLLWEYLSKQDFDTIKVHCGICLSGLFSEDDCEKYENDYIMNNEDSEIED